MIVGNPTNFAQFTLFLDSDEQIVGVNVSELFLVLKLDKNFVLVSKSRFCWNRRKKGVSDHLFIHDILCSFRNWKRVICLERPEEILSDNSRCRAVAESFNEFFRIYRIANHVVPQLKIIFTFCPE